MIRDRQREIGALLVDDKAFARDVGRRLLTAAGLNVILEASSCEEALALLQQADHSVDIVFCDLILPDMDGVEFVRHVSTLAVTPAFVLVSGADAALLSTVESTAKARGLNILGAVKKPLTLAAVERILTRFNHASPTTDDRKRKAPGVTAKDLKDGLANDQIALHYQPKVSIVDGVLDGFESLARWHHPDRGMIPPVVFIAVAEKHGLIGALTERTMSLALEQCATWAAADLRTKVSVNLSAYMLVDVELPDRLAEEARQAGIEPGQLVLEITESGLFQDTANTLEILARLHMKGFPLSIDDFGTGYSSMEQLSRVPFAEMKVDGAFVRGISENESARAILETSAELARRLGLTIVAEGAETQADWDMLKKLGVDLVQGYFVAKPMRAEEVERWAAAWDAEGRPGLN